MFRIKILAGSGLAALALALAGASASTASAKPCKWPSECYGVLLSPGVHIPVPEPDPIDIVSEGNVTFTGGTLVVNCPQGELNGSIIVVKGNLQASIGPMSFGGPGGAPCGSSMGPAVVSAGPAPGATLTQELRTNGKAQLSGPVMLKLSLDEAGMTCNYAAKSIKGAFNTDEEPIVIGSKVPKFTEREGSSPGCPKKLTGSANAWDVRAGAPAGGEFPLVFVG